MKKILSICLLILAMASGAGGVGGGNAAGTETFEFLIENP